MINLKSYKNIWGNGLKYNGKTTKEEFLDYFLIHYLIVIIINLLKSLLFFFRIKIVGYGNASYEFLDLCFSSINLLFIIYKLGSLIIQIPLSIRCLRNANAKWQWAFLNIINPIGCIIIYIFPLRKSVKPI